jgi:hypothetical protein
MNRPAPGRNGAERADFHCVHAKAISPPFRGFQSLLKRQKSWAYNRWVCLEEPMSTTAEDRNLFPYLTDNATFTVGDLDALGERIAHLSAQLQAATYQLLVMLRDFDQRGGWNSGFRSCAHWLNWRTGLELGAAREKMRVAHALAALPLLSAAMARGEVSFSKVRALTRVATPGNEEELLTFARAGTAAHVEKVVRAWRRVDRLAEQDHEQLRHAGRYLRVARLARDSARRARHRHRPRRRVPELGRHTARPRVGGGPPAAGRCGNSARLIG